MKSDSCVVVDYGIGNVFSVMHALKAVGCSPVLSRDSKKIENADRLILPGVGAFGTATDTLTAMGLDDQIRTFVSTGRPFLGICVGMQLLMEVGYEFGTHPGLALLPGKVDSLSELDPPKNSFKIPNIGWSEIREPQTDRWKGTILDSVTANPAYYFVHSFGVTPENEHDILAVAELGTASVVAAVQHDNIHGVQFHPERSGPDGLAFLDRFMRV